MAEVIINDRPIRVFDRQSPGGLGRQEKLIRAEIALKDAPPVETPRKFAELIRCYFAEEVDVEWLLDNLPADCSKILRACIVAAGGTVDDQGEAAAPQKLSPS